MMPAHFVCVGEIPRLPNGKVDRGALPSLASIQRVVSFVAPRDDIEVQIAEIWRDALGADKVGRDDNFFDLGGNSLVAIQVINRMNEIIDTKLPLGALFETPTVAAMAGHILEGGYRHREVVIALNEGGSRPPLFCLCGIHLYQNLAQHLGKGQPVYGLYIPLDGQLQNGGRDYLSVQKMAAAHVRAIQAQQPRGPYCLTGVSFGGVLAYEVARKFREAGHEVGVVALLDCLLPSVPKLRPVACWAAGQLMDITRGPLLEKAKNRGKKLASLARSRFATDRQGGASKETSEVPAHDPRAETYLRVMREYEKNLPRYSGDVLNFRALDRPVPIGHVVPADLGWARGVTGNLENIAVQGDHVGLLRASHVNEVVASIRAAIDRLVRSGSGSHQSSTPPSSESVEASATQ